MVIAGLSTGNQIGLGAVGAAFILFALISSFVLPARSPNFPGKNMGLYLTICIAFFVAMVAAVIIFGKEKKEAKAEPATTTAAQTTTPAAKAPQGDPVAGKSVFESAGCKGCHTLQAAGATGTVGPNLDQLKPAYARIVTQVTNGGKIMPKFGGQLTPKQIQDVAAYVFTSTH